MARNYAFINPDILIWARRRSQLSQSVLAKKLSTSAETLNKWEMGQKAPTIRQAQAIAAKTHIPLGYLYLNEPPIERLDLPDLRTVNGIQPNSPSSELLELAALMRERVSWYAEYLRDQGLTSNNCVGRRSSTEDVNQIVNDIRRILAISEGDYSADQDKYLRLLIKKIEQAGILVMKQATIRNHRHLSVSEFRGFAISDPVAPLIFINFADVSCARLFTLIHELAHIWLGQSGISDAHPDTDKAIEIKCNAIAAQFLVPEDQFLSSWQNERSWMENILQLRRQFRTSRWVIARRAESLGKITLPQYREYTAELRAEYVERDKNRKDGGDFYITKKSQISKPFSKAIVSEALSGKLLLREAGQLLDMRPPHVMKYAQELGI
jgi:Zn-dependent peptidase ImmA (M78 family)/DNA-binding XRE family transcriptional regulator